MNLKTHIQNYDWGKHGTSSFVAQLIRGKDFNQEINENLPYAELWMGTHPNGPSVISNINQNLLDYIKNNPNCLGEKVLQKFGKDLPYLFKVLSVAKALSIQVHPNKEVAKILNEQRPDLYKDPNHKPELAIAVTSFEALCGFRPYQEIKSFLQSIPELISVIGVKHVTSFLTSDEANSSKALQNCFTSLMSQESEIITAQLKLLLKRFATLDECTRSVQLAVLVERLYKQFPNDVGCFVVYFLNYIQLSPDEAIYLGANVPHAYLFGDCIECMACSDNVVRAGLTPKFKDVNTLCNILSYNMESASEKIFKPIKENSFTQLYAPPVEDFAVAKIHMKNNTNIELIPRTSASIILVTNGYGNNDHLALEKGTVIFLHANTVLKINCVSPDFTAYQAFANV